MKQNSFLQPGTWGCSHGSGFLGTSIRKAEMDMSKSERFPRGDHQASWAGHCFVFVGNQEFDKTFQPCIVEAEYPQAKLSPVSAHPDAVWAEKQPLTQAQRNTGVAAALGMVGRHYDWPAYLYFLWKVGKTRVTRDLTPLFTEPKWVICSGVVVVEQEAMGVDIGPLKTAAVWNPSFVCPADCLRWGIDNNWMNKAPDVNWK